jgi:uncharacterized UPF0160 family protein
MSAIKSISLGSNGLNIQFYDKISALKSLGDHLNLWNSKVNDEKSERDQARINAIERVKKFLEKRTTRTMPSTEV